MWSFFKDENSNFIGFSSLFLQDPGLNHEQAILGKNDFQMLWSYEESTRYRADDKEVMKKGVSKYGIVETQTVHATRKF